MKSQRIKDLVKKLLKLDQNKRIISAVFIGNTIIDIKNFKLCGVEGQKGALYYELQSNAIPRKDIKTFSKLLQKHPDFFI